MPARIEDFILVAGLNGCSTPVEQRPRHRNYSASSRLLYLSRPDMWCRRETLRRRLRRQVPGHKLLNSGVLPSKHPQFRVSLRIMWSKVALQTLDRERDRHPHAVVQATMWSWGCRASQIGQENAAAMEPGFQNRPQPEAAGPRDEGSCVASGIQWESRGNELVYLLALPWEPTSQRTVSRVGGPSLEAGETGNNLAPDGDVPKHNVQSRPSPRQASAPR